jgi:hypothetical protein
MNRICCEVYDEHGVFFFPSFLRVLVKSSLRRRGAVWRNERREKRPNQISNEDERLASQRFRRLKIFNYVYVFPRTREGPRYDTVGTGLLSRLRAVSHLPTYF